MHTISIPIYIYKKNNQLTQLNNSLTLILKLIFKNVNFTLIPRVCQMIDLLFILFLYLNTIQNKKLNSF